MPCHTEYSGRFNTTRPKPWERTKIDVDLMMHDELGNVHGYIRSAEDYTIDAIVLDTDGMTPIMQKKFFLIEKPEDEQFCEAKGYIGIEGTAGDLNEAAKKWVTEQYQTYVHSHEKPQDVYIVGGN